MLNIPPLENDIQDLFPNIDLAGFAVTSPINFSNTCFAWAGGDKDNIWQPSNSPCYVWFTGSLADSLENFIEQYKFIGYTEISKSSEYEPGFEKIAIYVKNGIPEHAARQLENGSWTSKIGKREDIEHRTLECLEGKEYGKVEVILKRSTDKHPAQYIRNKVSEEFENFKELTKNLIKVPKKEIIDQKNKRKKKANK